MANALGTYINRLSHGLVSAAMVYNESTDNLELTEQWETVTLMSDGENYKIMSVSRPVNYPQQHDLDDTDYHNGITGTEDNFMSIDADGLPQDSGYSASDFALASRSVCIVPFESDTAVSTGDGTVAFTIPAGLNGYDLTDVIASVRDKGVTGTTDIQVRRYRAGVDTDMLSTKITIGDEYYASDEGINESNDDLQTGDQIFIDVDAVHSGTAPNGLSVTLTFGK